MKIKTVILAVILLFFNFTIPAIALSQNSLSNDIDKVGKNNSCSEQVAIVESGYPGKQYTKREITEYGNRLLIFEVIITALLMLLVAKVHKTYYKKIIVSSVLAGMLVTITRLLYTRSDSCASSQISCEIIAELILIYFIIFFCFISSMVNSVRIKPATPKLFIKGYLFSLLLVLNIGTFLCADVFIRGLNSSCGTPLVSAILFAFCLTAFSFLVTLTSHIIKKIINKKRLNNKLA